MPTSHSEDGCRQWEAVDGGGAWDVGTGMVRIQTQGRLGCKLRDAWNAGSATVGMQTVGWSGCKLRDAQGYGQCLECRHQDGLDSDIGMPKMLRCMVSGAPGHWDAGQGHKAAPQPILLASLCLCPGSAHLFSPFLPPSCL